MKIKKMSLLKFLIIETKLYINFLSWYDIVKIKKYSGIRKNNLKIYLRNSKK